jgi:hypothetical protein
MRVFEETFGIDRIQSLVTDLAYKIKSNDYDPINGKFLFNDQDLVKTMTRVDEFTTRHATIKDNIAATYRIGNRLLDYLEKQVIIDFHLKGEHERLDKEYPELADKAKKFLGYEIYTELAVKQSGGKEGVYVPMEPTDHLFKVLLDKQADIQKVIMNELQVHDSIRGHNPRLPSYQETEGQAKSDPLLKEELGKSEPKEAEGE